MPRNSNMHKYTAAVASEFDVHGKVIIDGRHHPRNKFQKHKERKVMSGFDTLIHPVLHNFLHDQRVFAWMNGDSRNPSEGMWVKRDCLVSILGQHVFFDLILGQRLSFRIITKKPEAR